MMKHPPPSSPAWGATTKLVVALTFVAILAGLFVQFHVILGPLFMAFVLAYLLHPVAGFLQRTLRFPWQLAVTLIYFLLLIIVLGLLTLGGVGLVQQIQSLVVIVQENLTSLPDFIQKLSFQVYHFGPFRIDFSTLDLLQLSNQVLSMIQPLLGQTGSILSAIAGSAAQFLGWALFVMVISYFALAESGGLRRRIVWFDIPGYTDDIRRLSHELALIWNAFLRGQIIVFFLTALTYLIVFSLLGVRYAIGIAFLAGLAKFVPYIGPFVTWGTLALVSYFQPFRPFGLAPLAYTVIAVVLAVVIDQTFDNIITPRIIAQALRVHPAGVLVAAIIAANLLGLLGIVVAAPILATVMLFWRYTMRKMLDLNPWPETEAQPPPLPASNFLVRLRRVWQNWRERFARSN